CEAGKYKSVTGAGACSSCPAGTNSSAGSDAAHHCTPIPGYTADSNGVASTACRAGTFKSTKGTGSCEVCPGVSSAVDEGVTCYECSAGSYCERFVGQRPCPAHAWSKNGSSALSDCVCQGGYSGVDGGGCLPCALGTYKDADESAESETRGVCSACPWGTNSSLASTGVGECSCIAGHTAESDGVACAACEAGKYKSVTGAGACSSCPAGTNSSAGSDGVYDCICVAGYTAGSGGVACTSCAAGTYKSLPGVGGCLLC
ncbi:hypothetical protein T484DRAFT_1553557, partial [Baffinella frigidus]